MREAIDDIDRLLKTADPARAEQNAPLNERAVFLRDKIMSETNRTTSRRRLRRGPRITASALLTLAIAGGGTIAFAGSGGETPWGWIADNSFNLNGAEQADCFNGIRIDYEGLSNDDPIVIEARNVLRDIKMDELDTTAMEEDIRRDQISAADDPDTPFMSTDAEIAHIAKSRAAAEIVFDALRAEGYENPGAVSVFSQGESCE